MTEMSLNGAVCSCTPTRTGFSVGIIKGLDTVPRNVLRVSARIKRDAHVAEIASFAALGVIPIKEALNVRISC